MVSTVSISVAIFDNPGILNWGLFIEAVGDYDKTIIQVLGARHQYFPNISNTPALQSIIEILPLCLIDADRVEVLKNIAHATYIGNEIEDWNRQDYVLDILGRLENALIINEMNAEY